MFSFMKFLFRYIFSLFHALYASLLFQIWSDKRVVRVLEKRIMLHFVMFIPVCSLVLMHLTCFLCIYITNYFSDMIMSLLWCNITSSLCISTVLLSFDHGTILIPYASTALFGNFSTNLSESGTVWWSPPESTGVQLDYVGEEVLSLPHKFWSEPVRTDQIPIRNFQVEYLPNKQRTPSFFSDWILIRNGFPISSTGTESDHILTGSDQFRADLIGKAHISKFSWF